MELESLVDFEGTARWRRRVAEDYPYDNRNLIAADLLEKFAVEAASLEGSALHQALLEQCEIYYSNKPELENPFEEEVSDESRRVGFSSKPEDAETFLHRLLRSLVLGQSSLSASADR